MRYFLMPDLARVHADNGGLALLSPGWSHPRRRLTSSVLILGNKGHVPLVVGDEPLDLCPGRIVLLPAGLIHKGRAPVVDHVSYFWMHFTLTEPGELLSQKEADTILSSEGVTNHLLEHAAFLPTVLDLLEPAPFQAAFHDLLNQQENPTYTGWKFQLMFQSLLIQLTETVIRHHDPPPVSSSSSVVYGILSCIAEELTNPDLSIKGIASALGLNLDYAGRRFKQVMGMTVGNYILKERIKLACLQLQQTTDTLPAVASACGFGTHRHFLRQFKAFTGATPNEFRTRYRMMHVNSL